MGRGRRGVEGEREGRMKTIPPQRTEKLTVLHGDLTVHCPVLGGVFPSATEQTTTHESLLHV